MQNYLSNGTRRQRLRTDWTLFIIWQWAKLGNTKAWIFWRTNKLLQRTSNYPLILSRSWQIHFKSWQIHFNSWQIYVKSWTITITINEWNLIACYLFSCVVRLCFTTALCTNMLSEWHFLIIICHEYFWYLKFLLIFLHLNILWVTCHFIVSLLISSKALTFKMKVLNYIHKNRRNQTG